MSRQRFEVRLARWILPAALALGATVAAAVPIELVPGSVNMFRDTRGPNNANAAAGDRLQYGADIAGGSLGTWLTATYAPDGYADRISPCGPLAVSPNFCANSTRFDAGRLAVPWTLRFERAGEAALEVAAPSLAGAEQPVPFAASVTIGGSGTTPTMTWQVPAGFAPDAVRVNVFDRAALNVRGQADVIHVARLPGSAVSYTLPAVLSSGQQLHTGGDYILGLSLVDTRGDPALYVAGSGNAQILRMSSASFNFTPLADGAPPQVYLPTVVDGTYHFEIGSVGPDATTFIDPLIAIGYIYAIGAGDPNFASVLLPAGIGDNWFDLLLWDGADYVDSGIDLQGGVAYDFGAVGVGRFAVRGIEAAAGLDPSDATAFVTGLTFVGNGRFTGTMTPIVTEVPVAEPGSLALVLLAVLALPGRRRSCARPQRCRTYCPGAGSSTA